MINKELCKYLSCEEFRTTCGAGPPLRQRRGTWAATISGEVRCDSRSPANQRNFAKDIGPVRYYKVQSFEEK
jgi:hypothetical protein